MVSQGKGAELFSVPSKTYYYLAAGAAIMGIAAEGSELEEITDRFKNGEVFLHGAWKEIRDFILNLYEDLELLNQYKQNSLRASTHFTPQNAFTIYRIISEHAYMDY